MTETPAKNRQQRTSLWLAWLYVDMVLVVCTLIGLAGFAWGALHFGSPDEEFGTPPPTAGARLSGYLFMIGGYVLAILLFTLALKLFRGRCVNVYATVTTAGLFPVAWWIGLHVADNLSSGGMALMALLIVAGLVAVPKVAFSRPQ